MYLHVKSIKGARWYLKPFKFILRILEVSKFTQEHEQETVCLLNKRKEATV